MTIRASTKTGPHADLGDSYNVFCSNAYYISCYVRGFMTNTEQNDFLSHLYTMGYGEEYLQFIAFHDVEDIVGYFLACLEPGARVLDLGSGPGYLSVGLAEFVTPGKVYGVDIEPSQVLLAQQIARSRQCENAFFQVADVVDLPFEDASFDFVHCNDVLAYVPDTAAVLSEAKRVLKPGGILGCREVIVDSSFVHPDHGALSRGWEVFADLLTADDGHPQIGKDLKGHLVCMGFTNVRGSFSWETYSEPEELAHFFAMIQGWFLSSDVTEGAKLYGAATDELFDAIADEVGRWRADPNALAAIAFGEVLGRAPLS